MSRKLILLPGMTPGRRIFDKLAPHLGLCEIIDWVAPGRAKSISEYAQKLATETGIDSECDIVGVSFGGMVAQEIANLVRSRLCFAVSSVSSSNELRPAQKILARLPEGVHSSALGFVGGIANAWPLKGSSTGTVRARKFAGVGGDWYRWATSAALRWTPDFSGSHFRVIRVHGDRDRTFPNGHRHADHVITGAGHVLVITHSRALAEIIHQRQAEAE